MSGPSKKCGREVPVPVKSDSSGTCFLSSEKAVRGASFSCLVKKSKAHFRHKVRVTSKTRDRGIDSKLTSVFFRAAADDDLVSATVASGCGEPESFENLVDCEGSGDSKDSPKTVETQGGGDGGNRTHTGGYPKG